MTNENHAKQQAAAQLSSIREMLAALNVDYDRLAQLEELEEGKHLDKAELEELDELRQAAGECTSYDEAQQRIHDDPLSVQVRSGWYNPAMIEENATPEEFEILLCTGGPAVRIMGELDEHCQPTRAYIQYQDWGTPWTDYYEEGIGEACLQYAQQFYFGE